MARSSIIQDEKECFACHTTQNLHKHHIYYGTANRKVSDKLGLWVWLCARHHNMSDEGVHFDRKFDLALKRLGQEIYSQEHDDFMEQIGRSYL
jgi:hypothetical protein